MFDPAFYNVWHTATSFHWVWKGLQRDLLARLMTRQHWLILYSFQVTGNVWPGFLERLTHSGFVSNFIFGLEKLLWPNKPSYGVTPTYPRKLFKVVQKSTLIKTLRKWFVCFFLCLKRGNLPLYRLWIFNDIKQYARCEYWGGSPVSQHATRYRTFINKTLETTVLFSFIWCATNITQLVVVFWTLKIVSARRGAGCWELRPLLSFWR